MTHPKQRNVFKTPAMICRLLLVLMAVELFCDNSGTNGRIINKKFNTVVEAFTTSSTTSSLCSSNSAINKRIFCHDAFSSSQFSIQQQQHVTPATTTTESKIRLNAASSLVAAPVTALKSLSPTTRLAAVVVAFTAMIMTKYSQRILYPGVIPDQNFKEPLPPGSIGGCPWIGNLSALGNMNKFFYKQAKVADPTTAQPKLWKAFFFFKPTAVLAGSKVINQVLGREFVKPNSSAKKGQGAVSQITDFGNIEDLFGAQSLAMETESSKRYHAIRSLVGQAMTPKAVADSIPALQASAETALSKLEDSEEISVEPICRGLTLDVAWRQIIGLKFQTDDEIQTFYKDVEAWMKGIVNFLIAYVPKWIQRHLKCVKAKKSLEKQISAKIDALVKEGKSDGTTMGNMVFATDDEGSGDSKRIKLTRQEVIDNVFLLIIAGSETSANTLTCALLLLGMYPDVYEKLVKEQESLVQTYGTKLTKELLDETKAPYLDGVLKETMRLMPISGGGMREVQETLVVDGKQIPKSWYILYAIGLTHKQDPITQNLDGVDNNMDITKGYKPERWLSEATRPTTEFMPWGAGQRFCLGHTLATAEMKVFLATLARRVKSFDLKTDPLKVKWKEGIIRTPSDGVTIVPHFYKNGESSAIGSTEIKTISVEVPATSSA